MLSRTLNLGLRSSAHSLTRSLSSSPCLLSKASKSRTTTKIQKATLKGTRPSALQPAAPSAFKDVLASVTSDVLHASGKAVPSVVEEPAPVEKNLREEIAQAGGRTAEPKASPAGLLEEPSEQEQARIAIKAATASLRSKVEGSGSEIAAAMERRSQPRPNTPTAPVSRFSPPAPPSTPSPPKAAILSPSERKAEADERDRKRQADFGEDETIYTASPPFSVPLVLTAVFVFAVFSLTGADNARMGFMDWNKETEEYELAPAWKRYTFAAGFASVGLLATAWGALAPARIVTKLTIRRHLPTASTAKYPPKSLITIHTPITRLPLLTPRIVPLHDIGLLGSLSTRPQRYHPQFADEAAPKKPTGVSEFLAPPEFSVIQSKQCTLPPQPISRMFASLKKALIAPPTKSRRAPKPWGAAGASHSPIILRGDRFSYSLAVRRGPSGMMNDPKGAWCEDWEALERALLGVPEK